MDKLRAIEYFNRAVETGSFAAAARSLEVTTPAVTQSIAALERTLGTALFHRSQRGLYRGTPGVLLDHWSFEKNGERRTIDVGSRLLSDERLWLEEAACGGAGVIRVPDLTVGRYLPNGPLIPMLTDWTALEAPMIYAAYPSRHRTSRLMRVFLEFLVKVFGELERTRTPPAGVIFPRVPSRNGSVGPTAVSLHTLRVLRSRPAEGRPPALERALGPRAPTEPKRTSITSCGLSIDHRLSASFKSWIRYIRENDLGIQPH